MLAEKLVSVVKPIRYSFGNLRHLQGVREAVSDEVRLMTWEDLGFTL